MIDKGKYFVPVGTDEVLKHYGPEGSNSAQSAKIELVPPIGGTRELLCHEKAAPAIREFFKCIGQAGLWHCLRSVGPCYSPGVEGVPARTTMHAHGAALTLNIYYNPRGKRPPEKQDPRMAAVEKPGSIFYVTHPIVLLAKDMGFTWGGDDTRLPTPAEFSLGTHS